MRVDYWCSECKDRFAYKAKGNPEHCGVTSKRIVKYLPKPKEYFEVEKIHHEKMKKLWWSKEKQNASV